MSRVDSGRKGKGGTGGSERRKMSRKICDTKLGTKGPSLAAASLYFPESQDKFKGGGGGGEVRVREKEDGYEKRGFEKKMRSEWEKNRQVMLTSSKQLNRFY